MSCFSYDSSIVLVFRAAVSYMSERTYCVVDDGATSRIIHVICSVPQGSVLGPLLFVPYMDLAKLAAEYGVKLHVYADDNHLLIHCKLEDAQTSTESLEQCAEAISGWKSANRLKLNVDKPNSSGLVVKGIYKAYITAVKLKTLTLVTDTIDVADSVDFYPRSVTEEAQSVSFSYVNYDEYVDHLMMKQLPTLLLPVVSTTPTACCCWPVRRGPQQRNCSW